MNGIGMSIANKKNAVETALAFQRHIIDYQ